MGKKYVGNRPMIEKVLKCADAAEDARLKHERELVRKSIGTTGLYRRQAAQAKRERKREKALLERN